jgi:NAD(P)H-flavin reductase
MTLTVRHVQTLTERTRLLTLDAGGSAFAFHAGQALWLQRAGSGVRRPYSIASAPSDLRRSGALEFLVGLDERDPSGTHLFEAAAGSHVEVEGPLGGFDLPASVPGAPVLLVGGGTGIAPLRSMWRELLSGGSGRTPIAVVHSARTSQELAFRQELAGLEARGRVRVAVTVTGTDPGWQGHRGRVTEQLLSDHVPAAGETRCAICGPGLFVEHVVAILRGVGVPALHIATERW